ncbi:MAG TPA: TIGR02444 family protein [Stellaceae bacterium]|nr:TIGR02444 family protein [Stellaceae bacterium]
MAGQDAAANAFWRFSLMIYSRPGVADTLIRLQDERGHNVNLILFGLWLGLCAGAGLDAAGLERAKAAIAELDRAVVVPLRRLRRALKDTPDADIRDLRCRVLALELAAERRVQARLAKQVPQRAGESDPRAAAAANLRLILGGEPVPEELDALLRA